MVYLLLLFLAVAVLATEISFGPHELVIPDRLCYSHEYQNVCYEEGLRPLIVKSYEEAQLVASVVDRYGFWLQISQFKTPSAVWKEDQVLIGMGTGQRLPPVCRRFTDEEASEDFYFHQSLTN